MSEIFLPHNWDPRDYQGPLWDHMMQDRERLRAVCVWHRRAGKDLTAINICACKSQERVGTYWHMLPTYKQGRAIVWNGKDRGGRAFLSYFPDELVESSNQTEMRLTLKNGSIYQVVGTDNVDSLVGTNPVGVIFSEYSLHDPKAWDYVRPILTENGGWAVFIYTARGKNHGYRMKEMASRNPAWFCQVLTVEDTHREDGARIVTEEDLTAERAEGMSEEMIQQEYFCSFEAPLVGAYYGPQMRAIEIKGQITNVPWEPKLLVDTCWDIGVGDSTSIWFIQRYGMEHRAIDFYENSGEGLAHYAKILKEKPYAYGKHFAPHDIEVREFTSGKARIDVARQMGLRFTVIAQHEVEDGIETVRNILPQFWFDQQNCERGISGLREYTKEWDDKHKVFRQIPLHNWASHIADSFRYYAMGVKGRRKSNKPPQARTIDNYDYLKGVSGDEEQEYAEPTRRDSIPFGQGMV